MLNIQITTPDLIQKILPLAPAEREALMKEWAVAPETDKYEISTNCWDTYDMYVDALTDVYYHQMMGEVARGEEQLVSNMRQQARDKAYDHIADLLSGQAEAKKAEENKIEALRAQLNSIDKTTPAKVH